MFIQYVKFKVNETNKLKESKKKLDDSQDSLVYIIFYESKNKKFLYEGTFIKNAKIIKTLHFMIEKNKFVFVQIIFFSLSFFDKEFQKYYSDIIKES